MHAELAKLTKEFQIRLDQMRGRHAVDVAAERKTWRQVAEDRAQLWKLHRDQFNDQAEEANRGQQAPSPAGNANLAARDRATELQSDFDAAATKTPPRTVRRRLRLRSCGNPRLNARLMAPTNPVAAATRDSHAIMNDSLTISNGYLTGFLSVSESYTAASGMP
jgi:hypothetical protein